MTTTEDQTFYTITITGTPKGSNYSLYLQDQARRYSQGPITDDKVVVKAPASMFGPATCNIATPRTDRLIFATNTKVPFDFQGDTIINFKDIQNPEVTQSISEESPLNPQKPAPKSKSTTTGKKLITNPLQDQVQAQKSDVTSQSTDSGSKKNFWDRFK